MPPSRTPHVDHEYSEEELEYEVTIKLSLRNVLRVYRLLHRRLRDRHRGLRNMKKSKKPQYLIDLQQQNIDETTEIIDIFDRVIEETTNHL